MPLPATPKVGGLRGSPGSIGSHDTGAMENGKGKGSMVEPSPASTFGDTAAGDSSPMTPGEAFANGDGIGLFGGANDKTSLGHETDNALGDNTYLVVHTPDNRIPTSVNEDTSDTESNSGSEDNVEYPGENMGGVVVDGDGIGEDPFVSIMSAMNLQGNAGTASEADAASTSDGAAKFHPREDRTDEEVSPENAQALLPPNACVFVANLCQNVTDTRLQQLVHETFRRFGPVYVKIKRDARGMPFAFAQFEESAHADRAIVEGRGLAIHGRECRTERAKVNRSLYLRAADGSYINEHRAREILHGCGDLEKLWHPSQTDVQMYHLPEGIWVTFAFFQDARDAQARFRDNTRYRLEHQQHPPAFRLTRSALSSMNRASNVLLLSNFAPETTAEEIRNLFEDFGRPAVMSIELTLHALSNDCTDNFAYVEFRNEAMAARAFAGHYILRGERIKMRYVDRQRDVYGSRVIGNTTHRPVDNVEQNAAMLAAHYGMHSGLVPPMMGDANPASQPYLDPATGWTYYPAYGMNTASHSGPNAMVGPPGVHSNVSTMQYNYAINPYYGMIPAGFVYSSSSANGNGEQSAAAPNDGAAAQE